MNFLRTLTCMNSKFLCTKSMYHLKIIYLFICILFYLKPNTYRQGERENHLVSFWSPNAWNRIWAWLRSGTKNSILTSHTVEETHVPEPLTVVCWGVRLGTDTPQCHAVIISSCWNQTFTHREVCLHILLSVNI